MAASTAMMANGNAVCATVWQAFQRAIAQTQTASGTAATDRAPASFLTALQDAVADVSCGRTPQSELPPLPAGGSGLVSLVRRAFIDVVGEQLADGDDWSALAPEVVQVLLALGAVESRLDRSTSMGAAEQWYARHALAPIVEIAHDIRSPLTAILFLVEMLRSGRSGAVNSAQARQLNLTYATALGLNHLACDLIDFIRGADRLMDRQPIPFSIREVLFGVRDLITPMTEEKGLVVDLVTPSNDARVGDPSALSRIMLNLATNAVKFTPEGAIRIAAEEREENRVEFSVTDSGTGIPSPVLGQLFEPLRPSREFGTSSFSSAGLGISICHRLVTALGSELQFTTAQDVGTRFWFVVKLPVVQGD